MLVALVEKQFGDGLGVVTNARCEALDSVLHVRRVSGGDPTPIALPSVMLLRVVWLESRRCRDCRIDNPQLTVIFLTFMGVRPPGPTLRFCS